MIRGAGVAELVGYLDQYLRIREIPDESNAVNGLQVENASGRVERIVAAVDASLETIQGAGAGRKGSALLLVHHGLFWDGSIPITGRRYRRVRSLMDSDTALYAAHIPLDVHPEVGNNAVLARDLGLTETQPFDLYKGVAIGVQGALARPVARETGPDPGTDARNEGATHPGRPSGIASDRDHHRRSRRPDCCGS